MNSNPVYDQEPLSRMEFLLKKIAESGGGGGGGGGVEFVKVDELPQTGASNTIYFMRSTVEGEEDKFTEYVYLDGTWEKFGHYQDGTGIDYDKLSGKPGTMSTAEIDSLFDD